MVIHRGVAVRFFVQSAAGGRRAVCDGLAVCVSVFVLRAGECGHLDRVGPTNTSRGKFHHQKYKDTSGNIYKKQMC